MGEPFLMRALLAGLGLAVVAAPLGCFVVWRRMAYYGETVAQAGLIGIAAGLALSLNLTASVLIVTLAVSALLVLLSRQQVVPFNSLLGLLAHTALAVGVIAASLVRGPAARPHGLPVRRHLRHHRHRPAMDLSWRRGGAGRAGLRVAAAAGALRARGPGGGRGHATPSGSSSSSCWCWRWWWRSPSRSSACS